MDTIQKPKNIELCSAIDNRDYTLDDIYPNNKVDNLPLCFQSKKLKPKYQHFSSTCVCYALVQTINYILQNWSQQTVDLSREFIYLLSREVNDTSEGLSTRRAIKTMAKKPIPLWINGKWSHSQYPIIEKHYNKDKNKNNITYDFIDKYYKLTTIDQIKSTILFNGAVLMSIPIYKGSHFLLSKILKTTDKGISSYHAITCIGWNEEGFICQDSYGKIAHGNSLFIVPYDYPWTEVWGIDIEHDINTKNIKENKLHKFFSCVSYGIQLTIEDLIYYTSKIFKRKNNN